MSHLDKFDLRQLIRSETDSAIAKWGKGIEITLSVDTRHRRFITMVISRDKTILEQLKLDLPWADLEPTLSSKDPTPSPSKIIRAPGTKLLRASEFFFSKKTFTMVLQPTLADMQEEYFEALSNGRVWKARFVRLHGYCCFGAAVWGQLIITPLRAAQKIWTIAGGG